MSNETTVDERGFTLAICINNRFSSDKPSCGALGGKEIAAALEAGVRERGIDVKVERLVCFGACYKGPNVRLIPGGAFHHHASVSDVAAILDEVEARCGRTIDAEKTLPVPGA